MGHEGAGLLLPVGEEGQDVPELPTAHQQRQLLPGQQTPAQTHTEKRRRIRFTKSSTRASSNETRSVIHACFVLCKSRMWWVPGEVGEFWEVLVEFGARGRLDAAQGVRVHHHQLAEVALQHTGHKRGRNSEVTARLWHTEVRIRAIGLSSVSPLPPMLNTQGICVSM